MTHSFLKKALTFIGVAALAVPLALGLNGQKVSADDAGAPATQKVTLTKFASSVDQKSQAEDPTKAPNVTGKQTLEGAEFTIYDVTDKYWSDPDRGNEDKIATDVQDDSWSKAGKQVGTPITTNQSGQAEATLNTHGGDNADKPAVYLFVETKTPNGYNKSVNFILTLPVTAKDGSFPGNVYVYPKDSINPDKNTNNHYRLKFEKVDKFNQKTALAGAEFYITRVENGTTLYASYNGKAKVTGYQDFDAKSMVTWVAGKDHATLFVTGDDGTFGFAAASETRMTNPATADGKPGAINGLRDPNSKDDVKYSYIENTAPTGYKNDHKNKANNGTYETTISSSKNVNNIDHYVTDTPQGLLPHTGGAGIVLYVVVGAALVVLGTVAYKKRRAN